MPRTHTVTYLPGLKPLLEGRKVNYVARKVGVKPSTLSLIANLNRGASLDLALRLASYLDTSVEALAGRPNETAVAA